MENKKTHEQRNVVLTRQYRIILLVLVATFFIYNTAVYTIGTRNNLPPMSKKAMRGEWLWQKNNCTSCHQLYGLGGYLGPDLTNVISAEGKGPNYVKALMLSGIKAMPAFSFTKDEQNQIVAFLSCVDSTGYFPNHNAKLHFSGWVELEYKNITSESNE